MDQLHPTFPPELAPRSHKTRMLAGELYNALTPELTAERAQAADVLLRFNTLALEPGMDLLRSLLGSVGAGTAVRAPFGCDYGYNIHLGSGVFLNFGCVLLDVCTIRVGDGTQIGPGVHIYAADHPRDPAQRRKGLELGREVTIGRNVWIGGCAVILPGITVGDDAIIGAGSVVTRDVPAGATVVGNPAREKEARR